MLGLGPPPSILIVTLRAVRVWLRHKGPRCTVLLPVVGAALAVSSPLACTVAIAELMAAAVTLVVSAAAVAVADNRVASTSVAFADSVKAVCNVRVRGSALVPDG